MAIVDIFVFIGGVALGVYFHNWLVSAGSSISSFFKGIFSKTKAGVTAVEAGVSAVKASVNPPAPPPPPAKP